MEKAAKKIETIIVLSIVTMATMAIVQGKPSMPSGFTLCKRSEPNLNECLRKAVPASIRSIRNGIPEMGVPVLEPTHLESIKIGGNGGQVDLEQVYTDALVYGPVYANFTNADVSFTKDDCHMNYVTMSDLMTMTGPTYQFTGKMLLFTINGHGMFNITVGDLKAEHKMKCKFYTNSKTGKEHIKLTDWQETWNAGSVHFRFENLIDGNKELSANVEQVMNDNSLAVLESVQDGYEKTFASLYLQVANKIFTKIPFDELFLP